ncbi:MAG: SCO family protein [Planctomycetales bacterium]|nr:SCO family protein [Planctomycetales bacterium]
MTSDAPRTNRCPRISLPTALVGLPALLVFAAIGCEKTSAPAPSATPASNISARNIPADEAMHVTEFQLVDQDGKPFSAEDMKGKVWGVSFFFTACPGLCVKLNNAVNEIQKDYADSDARFLSVTVDPDVDTPEALTRYAGHYDADFDRWKFLTGDRDELKRVAREVFHQPHSKSTHNDVVSIVDRQGRIRGYFHVTDPTDVKLLHEKIDELLAES